MNEIDKKNLIKSIENLAEQIRAANSSWRYFLRGILIGLGTAIGASIIAAIALGIFAEIINLIDLPGIK